MSTSTRSVLRSALFAEDILVIPGVVDPWAARIAERAGIRALLATGAGIANTKFGLPDLGLLGLAEMADAIARIASSVDIPVIADSDNGYGNALNVVHTVRAHEAAGVAGVLLEDQSIPKKCGHFHDKNLVPTQEMVEKVVAFREASSDPDMVLVARTDAIAVEGFDTAIRRARAYVRAGADVLFVEAPRDIDELSAIPGLIDAPTIANIVEGGLTPHVGAAELQSMGYAGVFFANTAMRVSGQAMQRAFKILDRDGSTESLVPAMLAWDERQEIAGLPTWTSLESRIVEKARDIDGTPSEEDSQ